MRAYQISNTLPLCEFNYYDKGRLISVELLEVYEVCLFQLSQTRMLESPALQ